MPEVGWLAVSSRVTPLPWSGRLRSSWCAPGAEMPGVSAGRQGASSDCRIISFPPRPAARAAPLAQQTFGSDVASHCCWLSAPPIYFPADAVRWRNCTSLRVPGGMAASRAAFRAVLVEGELVSACWSSGSWSPWMLSRAVCSPGRVNLK